MGSVEFQQQEVFKATIRQSNKEQYDTFRIVEELDWVTRFARILHNEFYLAWGSVSEVPLTDLIVVSRYSSG